MPAPPPELAVDAGQSDPLNGRFVSYARILATMLDGVLVVAQDGRVVIANEAAARIFEVPRHQLLAPVESFFERFELRTPTGERPVAVAVRALNGEIVAPTDRLVRTPRGNGKAIRTSAAPLRDDHGTVIGAVIVIADVSAAKADEAREKNHVEALRASEERFRALVSASSDVLYRMSPDWSEMRQLRGQGGSFLAHTEEPTTNWLSKYIHPDDQPRVKAAIEDAVRAGRTFELEHQVLRADGSLGWTFSRAVPLKDADGGIIEWFGAAIDITDRKRAEETLREADRRKTEFLAVLSHELRNPLAPIRNSIFLLEKSPADSTQAARARQVIRRQTEHLTRLVDDLLDVTRISRGKVQLQRAVVDLRNLVRRACEDHRALFEESEIEMNLDFPIAPLWTDVDSTRIAQVMGNLLHNATKFTPPHGTVTVRLRRNDGHAVICVQDTGMGMAPEHVARMFELFAQEDRSLARTRGGLGLGLALSKGLIELHGGTIAARSEGPGKGSEFTITLPLAAKKHQAAEAPADAPTSASRRRVLVIEDNVDAARTLADVLEIVGHQVTVARDGISGIALARELKPDVVICDVGLPDVDGYEVAKTLRQDEALRSTRLIALSGYAQPEDKERAREAGFEAHLPKPAPINELTELLA